MLKAAIGVTGALALYFVAGLQASTDNTPSYLDTQTPEALFASIDDIEQQQGKAYADEVRTGVLFFLSKGLATETVSKALRDQAGQVEAIEQAQMQTREVLSQVPVQTLVEFAREREPKLMAQIRDYAVAQVADLAEHKARWAITTDYFEGLSVALEDVRIHDDRFGFRIPEVILTLDVAQDRLVNHVDFSIRLDTQTGEHNETYRRKLAITGPVDALKHRFDLNPLGMISVQILSDESLGDQLAVDVGAVYTTLEDGEPVRLAQREPFTDVHQQRLDRMRELSKAQRLLDVYAQ